MQDKSFKAWINMHLSRDKIKVEVRSPGSWVEQGS